MFSNRIVCVILKLYLLNHDILFFILLAPIVTTKKKKIDHEEASRRFTEFEVHGHTALPDDYHDHLEQLCVCGLRCHYFVCVFVEWGK